MLCYFIDADDLLVFRELCQMVRVGGRIMENTHLLYGVVKFNVILCIVLFNSADVPCVSNIAYTIF